MKNLVSLAVGALFWLGMQAFGATPAAALPGGPEGRGGRLEVEIQHPAPGTLLTGSETSIEVQGGASVFGGVKQLDLVLVIDTSSSLRRTDPHGYRVAGAIGLVESLPAWSDVQVGVVSFGRRAELVTPLTSERAVVVEALGDLGRGATTNLAAGIDSALEGFQQGAREGSTRVMLIFTDGKSNEKKARAAMARAQAQGVSIHTLLLGRDKEGERMLRDLAGGTGGSFLVVTDPSELPAAFLDLRTTGIESVVLRVNDSALIETSLTLGSFSSEVPLERGENRIDAIVTARDGSTRTESVTVTVRPEGCAELSIQAVRDGQPALSLSERSVEIVMDASRSMWGQLDGEAKMTIAKQTLDDALGWLPEDLKLSLRVYGHQDTPARRNCQDSQLLIPAAENNRGQIRDAIAGLKPKGQTPLGYSLEQVVADFEGVRGERAVVLVTDGIESCGGDAPAAARELQADGPVPVHVIGFGMADASDEDLASLQAIADASGGRFVTAGSARELQQALMTTVGTSYRISQDGTTVRAGTLGTDDAMRLPAGEYLVKLESDPPRLAQVELESEVRHTVVFDSGDQGEAHTAWRDSAEYSSCDEPLVALDSLTGDADLTHSLAAPTLASPAKPAARELEPARETGPRAQREDVFEVTGGTVEVWRNLRSDRASDWGVVVRHPSVGVRPRMIYSGNDRQAAEASALNARDTLRNGGQIELNEAR